MVHSIVFSHPPVIIGAPAAELEELRWLDLEADPLPGDLAPLLAGQIVPMLRHE
jgi:hypothetical protein